MHPVGDVHETAVSAPAFGLRSSDQRSPSHRSISGPRFVPTPTAKQVWPERQETPLSELASEPPGRAIRSIIHLLPIRRSASGSFSPARPTYEPTAKHPPVDQQDTAASALRCAPAGSGVLCARHRDPFQTIASVIGIRPGWMTPPTAVQSALDLHDTPLSAPPGTPSPRPVRSIDHLRPFHCSANVARSPPEAVNDPTATHTRRRSHETAKSVPFRTAGSAADPVVQVAGAAVADAQTLTPSATASAITTRAA